MHRKEKLSEREVREKLIILGAKCLSDSELLSIVIDAGAGEKDSVALSENLLSRYGNSMTEMSHAELSELRMAEGLGIKRAALLSAVFEIGRRMHAETQKAPVIIRSKEDVLKLLQPEFSRLEHEEMWVIYLTSANGVIEKRRVSQGGVKSLVVDYKLIIKRGIEVLATSLIIAHNHPSGIAKPSNEDIEITERLKTAANILEMALLDHIIIAENSSYSFRQDGLLK